MTPSSSFSSSTMIQSTAAAALPTAGGNKRSQSVSVRVWVAAVGYLGVVVRRCLSQEWWVLFWRQMFEVSTAGKLATAARSSYVAKRGGGWSSLPLRCRLPWNVAFVLCGNARGYDMRILNATSRSWAILCGIRISFPNRFTTHAIPSCNAIFPAVYNTQY